MHPFVVLVGGIFKVGALAGGYEEARLRAQASSLEDDGDLSCLCTAIITGPRTSSNNISRNTNISYFRVLIHRPGDRAVRTRHRRRAERRRVEPRAAHGGGVDEGAHAAAPGVAAPADVEREGVVRVDENLCWHEIEQIFSRRVQHVRTSILNYGRYNQYATKTRAIRHTNP